MGNFRDVMRTRELYGTSVDPVVSLLKDSGIVVEPEDVADFTLNIGQRHRFVEGWDMRYGKKRRQDNTSANHYPECALFYELARRSINEEIFPGHSERLTFVLQHKYHLIESVPLGGMWHQGEEERNVRAEIKYLCTVLDSEEYAAQTTSLALQWGKLIDLERSVHKLNNAITADAKRGGLEEALAKRRIKMVDPAYFPGTQMYGLRFCVASALSHFVNYDSTQQLSLFSNSKIFLANFKA